jgi:hypothetical protein
MQNREIQHKNSSLEVLIARQAGKGRVVFVFTKEKKQYF